MGLFFPPSVMNVVLGLSKESLSRPLSPLPHMQIGRTRGKEGAIFQLLFPGAGSVHSTFADERRHNEDSLERALNTRRIVRTSFSRREERKPIGVALFPPSRREKWIFAPLSPEGAYSTGFRGRREVVRDFIKVFQSSLGPPGVPPPPPFRPGDQVDARGRIRKRVRGERGGCCPPGESIENGAENGAEKGGMTSTTTTAPTAADLTGSRVVAVAVAPQCSASVADGSNGMGPPPEKKVAKASRMAEEILEGR